QPGVRTAWPTHRRDFVGTNWNHAVAKVFRRVRFQTTESKHPQRLHPLHGVNRLVHIRQVNVATETNAVRIEQTTVTPDRLDHVASNPPLHRMRSGIDAQVDVQWD